MFDEVVAGEVGEESAAVPGAVVRVGAEAEVEEGEVGDAVFVRSLASLFLFSLAWLANPQNRQSLSLSHSLIKEGRKKRNSHRHRRKRQRNRHPHQTPPQPPPMQPLPLHRQPLQHPPNPMSLQKATREQTLKPLLPKLPHPSLINFLQLPPRSRRQRLQPPLLKRNPSKQRVSILRDFFLPAFFRALPGRPEGVGFGDDAVGEGRFGSAGGEGGGGAFAVDEGAAGGDGEEEEAHCDSCSCCCGGCGYCRRRVGRQLGDSLRARANVICGPISIIMLLSRRLLGHC